MDEIFRINRKITNERLGFLEIKDRMCAHATLDMKYKEKLMELIGNEYKKYNIGKYRKKLRDSQFTLALFEQGKFIHIVCVCARFIGKDHNLIKSKAIFELKSIFEYVKN